jgi:hypothetical protein
MGQGIKLMLTIVGILDAGPEEQRAMLADW